MPDQVDLKNKLSIRDIPDDQWKDKRVLIRVDFNVPIADGKVTDTTRIKEALPTIKYILERKPKYIALMSHRGRPDGQKNKKYTLQPIVSTIKQLLGKDVKFVPDVIGDTVTNALKDAKEGDVLLLENLRFYIEEEGKGKGADGKKVKADKKSVENFRKQLSSYGDIYVNDAFGTAHRAHSSVVGINTHSGVKAAGFLMEKELKAFASVLDPSTVKRPYVAVLGGAKVSDKITVIDAFIDRVNTLVIGGGMAFTFKKVLDKMEIGKSLFDEKGGERVKKLIEKAKSKNVEIVLPFDFIAADKFPKGKADSDSGTVKAITVTDKEGIPSGYMGLDIGPRSGALFASHLWHAKTIVNNGPMGVFEYPAFASGTLAVLHATAAATQLNGAMSVLGGGDSVAAANTFGFAPYLTHLSTGGGASLELLEGKVLPGLAALSDKKEAQQQPKSKL